MRTFILAILFFLLVHNGLAQQLPFVNFTTEDGLPSDETYEVFEDSKGYIWVATDRGVARYNGYKFEVFTTADGLADNTVFNFYEDYKGRIWFFTFNGTLGFYHEAKFYTLKMGKEDMFTTFLAIYVSPKDEVIIQQKTMREEYTGFLSFQMDGNTADTNSLYLYKRENESRDLDKFEFYKKAKAKYVILTAEENLVTTSFSSRGNRIVFRKKNGEVFTRNEIGNEDVHGITGIGKLDSTFYVTTWGGDILEYELEYPYGVVQKMHIKNYTIANVLRDSYGGVWVSSLNKGVLYSPNPSISVHPIPVEISVDGLKKMATDGQNEVIIDSYDKVYIGSKENYELVTTFRTNVEDVIYKDSVIYIQTHSAGGIVKNNEIEVNEAGPERKKKYLGYCMADRPFQELLSCGSEFVMYGKDLFDLKGAKRLVCLKQKKDTVWFGGMNGLFAISLSQRKQLEFKKGALLSNRINYLELLDDRLLIATRGNGLLIKNGDKVFQIKAEDGLVNNSLSKIVTDQHRTAWISSNSGISKITFNSFEPLQYEIENLGREDGLLTKKINDLQLFRDTLYILTTDRLYKLPKDYVSSPKAPILYIKQLLVNNKVNDINESINLAYNENNLEVSYEGLYYANSKELIYLYSMDGGSTWLNTENRSIPFYGLSYGDYTLQIKAVTSKGIESEIKELTFTINRPYWARWWFVGFWVGVFILAVYGYVRRKVKQSEREAKIQGELYKLENKALSSQMNPHFIFNALTAIQHFIIKKDKYEAYNYLTQFSKLIRSILKNSEDELVALQEELDLLENYLKLEQVRFENNFEYIINIDTLVDTHDINVPSMLIQPYVENAIRHGFLHKEGKGLLKIDLVVEEGVLVCSIQDNGIGREKSKELKKDNGHKSFAMSINERRLELLNQLYKRNLSLKVEDLYDGKQPLGTKVTLYIPVNSK